MSVTLISVSHDTVVSNKHEEWTRYYYVNFQHQLPQEFHYLFVVSYLDELDHNLFQTTISDHDVLTLYNSTHLSKK